MSSTTKRFRPITKPLAVTFTPTRRGVKALCYSVKVGNKQNRPAHFPKATEHALVGEAEGLAFGKQFSAGPDSRARF
jgi:hypothetical protein